MRHNTFQGTQTNEPIASQEMQTPKTSLFRRRCTTRCARDFNFSQQAMQEFLFMENRLAQQGQCIPSGLVQASQLDEPAMGTHPSSPEQTQGGQGDGTCMFTNLASQTMVEECPEHDVWSISSSQEPAHFRTPGNLGNPGGRDKEGVAQSEGETCSLLPALY